MASSTLVRSSLTAVALPLLLTLGACAPSNPPPGPETPAQPPAELAHFYNQELTFGPCADYATTAADQEAFANGEFECAQLEVPLDYDQPEGRTAQIALLRLPARGEPVGSLLFNPGGPGASGMSAAASLAGPLAASPIGEKFDLIGFDPRGVGASTPALDCYTDAERDDRAMVSSLNSDVQDWTEDETRQLVAQRAERSGGTDVLAHVGTRDAARDMDVLRAVLGDEKLNFFGQSYGTGWARSTPRLSRRTCGCSSLTARWTP